MTEQEVFILSNQALVNVVDQIKDNQWSLALPEWFQVGAHRDRSTLKLQDIINYHAYDDAWVPDVLAGKTKAEVGSKYDGDLLGADPRNSFMIIANKSIEAVRNLGNLEKIVHISYGDFPAQEYLKHITCFRSFRAYDISKLIGVDSKLPEDLLRGMWDEFAPEAEEWRAMGVFGPEVEVPAGADLQTKLLGMSGRTS